MMNRRSFIHATVLVATGSSFYALAAEKVDTHPGRIGHMDPAEFRATTAAAGARVAAIVPTTAKLSQDDTEYLKQLANGGLRNLEGSQLAVAQAFNADVRVYAQVELEEQMGLGAKLKEIAAAKGVLLPTVPDDKSRKAIAELTGKTGSDFDRAYLKEFGITGHEMLRDTVGKIKERGGDKALEELAAILQPIIVKHLEVARDENANID